MAKKRGGLAGIWDRNKGAIKALAPIALGAIPGVGVPLAAVAGAAMGGLDRPGKSGIGLDLGGALKGGATGYLGGQTGKALAGGVKGLLAPKSISPVNVQPGLTPPATGGVSAPSIDTTLRTSRAAGAMPGVGTPTATAPGMGIMPDRTMSMGRLPMNFDMSPVSVPSIPSEGGRGIGDMLRGAGRGIASAAESAGSFASRNKDLLTMAGKGLMSQLPNAAEDAEVDLTRAKIRDMEEERERRRRMAELLMPYASDQFPQFFGMNRNR